jgi:asparagine synthase (glutamine-hydrolysing)
MCGLVGLLGPGANDADLVVGLAEALVHRGPDARGLWQEAGAGFALAHRRLSILDLSPTGAQPMVSTDQRWVLAFNGEIYNHAELRSQLQRHGHQTWRGHSDTETLLEAIATWGPDTTLTRCNGMFALAAWDRHSRALILARDRFGEKPLYVGAAGPDLVFASELKAFRRHPAWRHAVEPKAVAWLLEIGYIPAPWSIHPGVFKLPAGCLLKLGATDAGWRPDLRAFESRLQRWWRLEDTIAEARALPWEEGSDAAVETLRCLLDDAVRLRMEADVPVGALLSGGIDSTLIVASMARQSASRVRTFTIGFDDPGFDESGIAQNTAERLGTEHQQLRLRPGAALDLVERLPDVYDEPFADAAQIPALLVSEAARREVSVVLTGDGGDEIFHGYQRYLDAERMWNIVGSWPWRARDLLSSSLRVAARAVPAGSVSTSLLRQGARLGAHDADDYGRALMRLVGAAPADATSDPAWPPTPAALRNAALAERLRWRDQAVALPEGIHTKLDRASMSVGLELRAPLLDPRLLEFAWRLPLHWHAHRGMGKCMLRRLTEDLVPGGLSSQRKHGFDVPIAGWLRGPLRDWAESLLAAQDLQDDAQIDSKHARWLWSSHLSGRSDHGYALWALLMYRAWSIRHG